MKRPAISVLLCTVRPDQGYIEHSEWNTLGKVVDDLNAQTFKDFELIIVDGVRERTGQFMLNGGVTRVPPRDTLWTRNKKVAISTYRNSGLTYARGELVVNLDDCCELPPTYLETFHYAWEKHRTCLGMLWPEQGDVRPAGRVDAPGRIYGFGSYPLEVAVALNGYDEAYDGAQGLEDVDWSTRLFNAGVKQALLHVPDFKIHAQSGHDPRAIDAARSIVRCCNTTWRTQRQLRNVTVANTPDLWSPEWIRKLVGPCTMLVHHRCGYHGDGRVCAYLSSGFATGLDPLAAKLYDEPPVFDLAQARKEAGVT